MATHSLRQRLSPVRSWHRVDFGLIDRARGKEAMSFADEIEKLFKLHAAGALTDAEYVAAKAKLVEPGNSNANDQCPHCGGPVGDFGFCASCRRVTKGPAAQVAQANLAKPAVTASGLGGALGCIVLIGILLLGAVICSVSAQPSGSQVRRPSETVQRCREENLRRILACDSECAAFTSDAYDACTRRCAASRGEPIRDCD